MEETVVWMVPLRQGGGQEFKGTLRLEPPHLVFTERRDGERIELALAEIRRVRRVLGSPVLVVTLGDKPNRHNVAFYFSQPPPLRAVATGVDRPRLFAALGGGGGSGRSDRTTKRVMRTNVGYLSNANAGVKHRIEDWLRAIKEAAG